MIYYLNSKGKRVDVTVTRHAVFAFQHRYKKLFDTELSILQADNKLIELFPLASRVKNHNIRERTRIKRYGHSLYLRDANFTYVIHDGHMMTVEISKKGFRNLNKLKGTECQESTKIKK